MMQYKIKYLIGVDGGGSGTRVVITDTNSNFIAEAQGEPSALSLGIEKAWQSILNTIIAAFDSAKIESPMLVECAIGLGLSGVNNTQWKKEFLFRNPGFKIIEVDTDGYTTLLGAHGGKPGTIVALGTGSIGMILKDNGERQYVSGWGYPSGDEASGSWLGIRAIRLAEKVLDNRKSPTILTKKILEKCGNNTDDLLDWLGNANQNTYATLAPIIFSCTEGNDFDQDAVDLLNRAGREVEMMARALDPNLSAPFCICGRLGEALIPFLPSELKAKNIRPLGDSSRGALLLIKNKIL